MIESGGRSKRWLMVPLVVVVLGLLSFGIANAVTGGGALAPDAGHRTPYHATSPRAGELLVHQTLIGTILYTEGSQGYVAITRPDGTELLRRELGANTTVITLNPGRYGLRSWQRPCDANCSHLDPPADSCRGSFVIGPHQSVTAVISLKPGHGCDIDAA